MTDINGPELWVESFPHPAAEGHKYHRGHVLIYGAPELTGATRLAAESAARIGAGLVTVVGGQKADIYRASLPPHILVRDREPNDVSNVTSFLAGPGGIPKGIALKRHNIPVILDAEAIGVLGAALNESCVLTPHEGEFARYFPHIQGEREERALTAAKISGAVMVLKGPRTVIAAPDGRFVVNDQPVPWLATAGSGDVLAGMIAGLTAQGMPSFSATCASVWLHTQMGAAFGPGLAASDLPNMIPVMMRQFFPA